MKQIFLKIFCILLLASCQDNKKEQLLHLVQEWQGKEIRFPEKPVFTRFVTDTTHHRLVRLARRTVGRQKHEMRGECDRQPDCKRWIGRREALHRQRAGTGRCED